MDGFCAMIIRKILQIYGFSANLQALDGGIDLREFLRGEGGVLQRLEVVLDLGDPAGADDHARHPVVLEAPGEGHFGERLSAAGGDAVQFDKRRLHPGRQGRGLEELLLRHPGIGRDAVQVAAGQEPLRQRREGDEAHAVLLGLVQDRPLRLPVQDVVPALVDQARNIPVFQVLIGKGRGLRRVVGDARVQRLAGPDDIHEGLHRLLQRGLGVEPMGVEEVHVIEVHPFQALVQARHQVFAGAPFAVGTGPHVIARLGGDEQLVAEGGEGLAHDHPERFLGRPVGRTVVVGEVEVDDTVVEGVMGHLQGVRERVYVAEVVPQAQGDLGEEDAAAAAPAVPDSALIAAGGGGVDRIDHVCRVLSKTKIRYFVEKCLSLLFITNPVA